MKKVRSALLFFISVVMFSACFKPPEFGNAPSIKLEGLQFERAADGNDLLTVSVSFKDGDGDIGFNGTSPADSDSPYHDINFFTNKAGERAPVASYLIKDFKGYVLGKTKKTPRQSSYLVLNPGKNSGELITLQHRSEGFPSLPPYADPYKCAAYAESYLNQNDLPDTIYVWKDDKHLIKNKATKVDSLYNVSNPSVYYYAVVDHFYIQPNVGQYNMYVKFFIRNSDGSYTEFDWAKEFCETYNGRIPVLTDRKRPLEGIINYSMTSSGFLAIFGTKLIKLEITIYDKALNASNTVVTSDFRLEEI